jgi:ATP/ADP translocase
MKSRVPKTQKSQKLKFQKKKKKKKTKSAEPNESSENLFESKYLSFLFVLAYKCYELFRKE